MERKAQNKGRGRKRKNNQDVKETTKPKNEETETSNSKVVPTFSKKQKVTKKHQEIFKSDGVIPNTEDQEKDLGKEIEEDENTQGTVGEESQLEATLSQTLVLEEQTTQKDITCPSTTKSEDMKQFSISEKSSKMSEKIGSLQTTEVSDAVPLLASPLEKSEVTTNMSDLEGLDAAATTIEHPMVNKDLHTRSHESGIVTGLIEEPREIQVGKIEIYPQNTEIPAESTELPSIDTTFIPKSTKLPALDIEKATTDPEISAPKEEEKETAPQDEVQLEKNHKKEQNVCLEQMHTIQETMIVLEENKEHSMEKEKSDTLQQHGGEHPEADKIIPKAVPGAHNDPVTDSLTKVDQQDLVLEQIESQNQIPHEAEERKLSKCLNGKELSTGIQELKTMKCQKPETSNEFTVKFNENHDESQPPPKNSRKCFSLEDDDTSEGPNSGDTKNDFEEIVSTCIEEIRQPVDKMSDLDINEAKSHPSNKEKKSLFDVSPPENIKTDTAFDEKPGCEDGLEGDMDITDSQLCEAVNLQESNSTLNSLEEAKKHHLEGRKIIRDLIVDLSYLNKMLLRTKREIESARRRKQPGGNRNSW